MGQVEGEAFLLGWPRRGGTETTLGVHIDGQISINQGQKKIVIKQRGTNFICIIRAGGDHTNKTET